MDPSSGSCRTGLRSWSGGAVDGAGAGDAGGELVELRPLVYLDPPTVVEVLVDGEWWPGTATAYRGRAVDVTWSKGPGMRHMTWVPADRVRRV